MQKAEITSGRTKRSIPPELPAQGVVRAPKAAIFTVTDNGHVLEKVAGPYYKKGVEITAIGIVDCTLDGRRKKAVMFRVPDRKSKTGFSDYYLVKADVVLKKSSH